MVSRSMNRDIMFLHVVSYSWLTEILSFLHQHTAQLVISNMILEIETNYSLFIMNNACMEQPASLHTELVNCNS